MANERLSPTNDEEFKFICSEQGCRRKFKRRDRLLIHIRTHTGERPYKCNEPGCDKSYCRQPHLLRHQQNAHGPLAQQKDLFICTIEGCGKEFTLEQNYQRHYRRTHGSEAVHRYKCGEKGCGATFRKHHQLRAHSYSHTDVDPYRCPHPGCPRTFPTPSRMRGHSKMHQGYTCDNERCNRTFSKWTELRRHKSKDHLEVFPCAKCNKTFPLKHLLNDHLRTHEEKSCLSCPYDGCDRMYWDKKNLKAHIATYHEGKCFTCDQPHCEKTFASKQKLKEHLKTHRSDYTSQKIAKAKSKKAKKSGRKKSSMASRLSGVSDKEMQHHEFSDPVLQEEEHNLDHGNQPLRKQQSTVSKSELEVLQAVLKVKLQDHPSTCAARMSGSNSADCLVSGDMTGDESMDCGVGTNSTGGCVSVSDSSDCTTNNTGGEGTVRDLEDEKDGSVGCERVNDSSVHPAVGLTSADRAAGTTSMDFGSGAHTAGCTDSDLSQAHVSQPQKVITASPLVWDSDLESDVIGHVTLSVL